jgi:uncharacterized membrane protein YebE (DUF533 family)
MYLAGILFVCGLLLVLVGVLLLNRKRQVAENLERFPAENSPDVAPSDTEKEVYISDNQIPVEKDKNKLIFENLIALAAADGQLTPNEQKILQEKAAELGLDYNNEYIICISQSAGTPIPLAISCTLTLNAA